MDEYLSVAYKSDIAFENLISYFEKQDEKVVICMFGDHHPSVTSFLTADDAGGTLTKEEQYMNRYKTPFVIWANYDIEEAEGLDIGMSYLGVLLQEKAGVNLTPYFLFLEKQMKEAAKMLGGDLYILPSSVHEVIVVPAVVIDPTKAADMVREINQTVVEPREFLSDMVLKYAGGKITEV